MCLAHPTHPPTHIFSSFVPSTHPPFPFHPSTHLFHSNHLHLSYQPPTHPPTQAATATPYAAPASSTSAPTPLQAFENGPQPQEEEEEEEEEEASNHPPTHPR